MRQALERIFGRPFPKRRPPFLLNPETGRRLEADAYCEELKLMAEFSGIQHRVYPNPYHSTRAQFEAQQQRDALKAELCAKAGVKLVIVPDTVAAQDIERFLLDMLVPYTGDGAMSSGSACGNHICRLSRVDTNSP